MIDGTSTKRYLAANESPCDEDPAISFYTIQKSLVQQGKIVFVPLMPRIVSAVAETDGRERHRREKFKVARLVNDAS